MKRNDAEQIGKLIRNFLRQESLESPLNERRLISSWAEVLGPTIASYTRELYIKNQVLYVHLTSAALRQELMMGRDLLVRNLNRHVGAQVTNQTLMTTLDEVMKIQEEGRARRQSAEEDLQRIENEMRDKLLEMSQSSHT